MLRAMLAVTVATTLAALSGCDGSGTPSATPETRVSAGVPVSPSGPASPAAAPSPTTTPTAASTPPPARPGARGQEAFARYVMDLWGEALRTDDASTLLALGPHARPCDGCQALAHELARRRRDGWHVDFPGLEVRSVRLTRPSPGTTTATARVDIPASSSVQADGSFRSSNPAHPHATFTVRMQRSGKHYRLLSFGIASG